MEWRAFETIFGPITVQERVDVAGGLSAWGALSAAGSKARPEKFMPDWGRQEGDDDEDEDSDLSMIATMRAIQESGVVDDGDQS